ncbi:non-specific lipid-transfer protein 2P [Brachypodium distachyon]|uniref:Bifunctional inhibitor/plant lipid transfer protein/seed storage helical domain-containing protein n=1 Tax=Brachypodium distachyon TaxID=15368 RepID=I1HAM6_BRADI|nr:non-specific lipid-transfer protein 2P [Brachypodium distachyon]KQK24045.1 hypothetical protein BRADI_1g77820v3 [Brachypodium distachyon]|eukprot:XP_003558992.1 non-specific lipid-transfer protein 2P [Brachypodium distachyon]
MAMTMRKMAVVAVMLVLAMAAQEASAAGGCNAGQLSVCAVAITSGSPPSAECCSNLRAQQGCLCQYAKDPNYGRYISSPYARQTVASCGIPVPKC